MNNPIQLTKAIAPVRDATNSSPRRRSIFLVALGLALFPLLPMARAVSPPPDGAYSNYNTAEGQNALFSLTSGSSNTAVGFQALYTNTTGSLNTANGNQALLSNTTGSNNTAVGDAALRYNTTGYANTANGDGALSKNTTGQQNTANGAFALINNTTGSFNTGSGSDALNLNTTGSYNTAIGGYTLQANQTGSSNTANGYTALYKNTTGFFNAANGVQALYGNTTGYDNAATGANALVSNTTGTKNTANGAFALSNNTTGSSNVALGISAGTSLTTGSNNIDVANSGVAGEAGTIRLGTLGIQTNTYIAGIYGVTTSGGVGVYIDSNGHLGTITSSARYKDEIKPMDKASEAILALQPVTFRYKHALDPKRTPQFGLVAEQVEKVNPDLVARDEQGKPYTVRYEAVNAMLLNEFLKAHRKVAGQQRKIEELTSQLDKISNEIEQLKSAHPVIADR